MDFKSVTDKVGDKIYLSLNQLVGMQGKLKTLDKQSYEKFKNQILENGFISPFHVWTCDKGKINLIDGHTRLYTLQMMKQEGIHVPEKLPAITIKANSRKEAVKMLMGMVSQYGKANDESLSDFAIAEGLDFDWIQTNTDIPYIDLSFEEPEIESNGSEDEVPEVVEPKAKLGQIYKLGDHRLMCGDSTSEADVAKLMNGEIPNIMMTDPPYGVKLDQSWRDVALGSKAMGKGNKNLVQNDDRADWTDVWKLFKGNIAYVWHAGKFTDVVMQSLRNADLEPNQQIIWNKSVMIMGRSDYHFKHEPCWYAVRKGKKHDWIGDRKQTTIIDAAPPNHIMAGSKEDKTEHPTQKPVSCMELIKNHSGDVFEPFGGSGSTLIACENIKKKCFVMELEPKYVDIIIARWEKFTGKKAELINE